MKLARPKAHITQENKNKLRIGGRKRGAEETFAGIWNLKT